MEGDLNVIGHYKYDCRLFSGYKPCPYQSRCRDCQHYLPKGPQVLVVRVHQLGNIVKSTPLLHALHRRFDDPWVTWLASTPAAPMLRGNPLVNEVIEYSWEAAPYLLSRRFDLVLSLEANPAEAALAQLVPADERLGFGVHESGSLRPLNEQSVGYVSLSLSDPLRFEQNDRTLAQLCFDLLGVPYQGEEYILCPSDEDLSYARALLHRLGVDPDAETLIALATGGNTERFQNKDWPTDHFASLARLLSARTDSRLLLVGGPLECEINRDLARELGDIVIDTGCDHTIMQFAALLSLCDLAVGADSFPLHAAVAVRTHVIALFGPTPPQEIAIFGRGRKIVTDMDCAPCYIRDRADCPHDGACMRGLSPERVADAAIEVLDTIPP